jgi:phospholipid/cholesterol/gamma-HCH transport system substrate-binding protein
MNRIDSKEIWAGAFFLIGVIIIIITALALGGKTGLGESRYYLEVVFSDIGGLRIGAPVRAAGVDVGTVVNISFIDNPRYPDKRVKVTLSILSKYRDAVAKYSLFSIKTEGLLGDKLIDIQIPRGDQAALIPDDGEFIVGQDPLDIKNLADDFSETTKYFIYLSKKMTDMIEDLRKIALTSKRVLDRVEDRIIEGGLLNLFMGRPKR